MRSSTLARDLLGPSISSNALVGTGPLGGEEWTKLLAEMNSLVDVHESFIKSREPRLDVL